MRSSNGWRSSTTPPAVIRLWATTALLPTKGCTTRRLLRQHDHHSQPVRETGGSSNLVLPALLRQSVARRSDQHQRPDLQVCPGFTWLLPWLAGPSRPGGPPRVEAVTCSVADPPAC